MRDLKRMILGVTLGINVISMNYQAIYCPYCGEKGEDYDGRYKMCPACSRLF